MQPNMIGGWGDSILALTMRCKTKTTIFNLIIFKEEAQMKSVKTFGFALFATFLLFGGQVQGQTLAEAIDTVIQTNPQVRSQVFNRLSRDGEVTQAQSGYLPTVDLNAAAGFSKHRKPEPEEDLEPWEASISVRQNLFTGFATMNEVDRQRARVRSSAYALQGTSENLALQTTRAYLDVLRNEELKRIAEQNRDTHLRIMDQIKLRSESGVGSQVDTDQVQGRLALAESNVIVAETNLLDSYSNYQSVVGNLPENLVRPTAPAEKLPSSLEQALEMAVAGHPTLKSANADLEARQSQYEVAKGAYYPVVDLELDQRWDEEVSRVEGERDETIFLARIRYNLFNGFKDSGRKAQTLEQVGEAREVKNNTQRQVVESMRLSWMAYQSVLDRIDFLRKHIESTRETAQAYSKQFDIGKRTLLDVLDTEAEAINAKIELVNAEADGLYSQYRILNSMGSLVHAFDLQWPEESLVDEEEE